MILADTLDRGQNRYFGFEFSSRIQSSLWFHISNIGGRHARIGVSNSSDVNVSSTLTVEELDELIITLQVVRKELDDD